MHAADTALQDAAITAAEDAAVTALQDAAGVTEAQDLADVRAIAMSAAQLVQERERSCSGIGLVGVGRCTRCSVCNAGDHGGGA